MTQSILAIAYADGLTIELRVPDALPLRDVVGALETFRLEIMRERIGEAATIAANTPLLRRPKERRP